MLEITSPTPHIVLATLARPEAANALNTPMAATISKFFNALEKDTRVVILTGSGSKAFCAGADLKERKGMDDTAWEAQHAHFRAARDAVENCPVPVLAAVNGAAFGGGCELALACDFIYAAPHARFALPEATLGIMPGMGGTQTLPRAVGERAAKELLFTGRSVTAEEAHALGLVNRVCTDVIAETLAVAEIIAANAPLALRAIKQAMRDGHELKHYHTLLPTKDRHEGINAFNDKRKPVYCGA